MMQIAVNTSAQHAGNIYCMLAKLQQQLLAVLHTTASCKHKHDNGS